MASIYSHFVLSRQGLITANSDIFDSPPSLTSTGGMNSLDDCEVMKKRRFVKRETKVSIEQNSE